MLSRLWGTSSANKQADDTGGDEFGAKAGLGGFGSTSTAAVHEDFLVGSSDPRSGPKRVSSNAKPLPLEDHVEYEVDNDTDDTVRNSPTRKSSNPLPLSKDFEDAFDCMDDDDDDDDSNSVQDSVTIGSSDPDSAKWRNKHLSNFLTDFATSSADASGMSSLPDDAMAAAFAQAAQELEDDDDWSQVSELSTLSSRQRKQQQQEIIDKANAAAAEVAMSQVQPILEEEESSSCEESESEKEAKEEDLFMSKDVFPGSNDSAVFDSANDAFADNAFANNDAFKQEQDHDAFADNEMFKQEQQADDTFVSNDVFGDSNAFRQQQDEDAFSSNDAFADSGSFDQHEEQEDGEESSHADSKESEQDASLSQHSQSIEQNSFSQEDDSLFSGEQSSDHSAESDHEETRHLDEASCQSEESSCQSKEYEKHWNTTSEVVSQESSHSYSSHSESSTHEAPTQLDDLSEKSSSEFEQDDPSEYDSESEQPLSECDQSNSNNSMHKQIKAEFDILNDFHDEADIASQCSAHSDDDSNYEEKTQQGSDHSASSHHESSEDEKSNDSSFDDGKDSSASGESDLLEGDHEASGPQRDRVEDCSSDQIDHKEEVKFIPEDVDVDSSFNENENKLEKSLVMGSGNLGFAKQLLEDELGDEEELVAEAGIQEQPKSTGGGTNRELAKQLLEDESDNNENTMPGAIQQNDPETVDGEANLKLAKQELEDDSEEERDAEAEPQDQPKPRGGGPNIALTKQFLEDDSDEEEQEAQLEAEPQAKPKLIGCGPNLDLAKQLLEDDSDEEEEARSETGRLEKAKLVGGGTNLDLAKQLLEDDSDEEEEAHSETGRLEKPKSLDRPVNQICAKQLLENKPDDTEDFSPKVQSRKQLLEGNSEDGSKEEEEETFAKGDDVSSMHDDDVFVSVNSASQLHNDTSGNPDLAEGAEVSESEESESGSDESDSDEDSDDGEDGKPFKLVVKEAPLLRLENVTSQTRNNIVPVKKNTNKGGGWGWFGFASKNEENPQTKTPAPIASGPEVTVSKAQEPESVRMPKEERKPVPDAENQKVNLASETSALSKSSDKIGPLNTRENKKKTVASSNFVTVKPAEESSKRAGEKEIPSADTKHKEEVLSFPPESKSSHSISSKHSEAISLNQGTDTRKVVSKAESFGSLPSGVSDSYASPVPSPSKSRNYENTTSLKNEVTLLPLEPKSPSPSVKSGSIAQGSTGSPRKSPKRKKKKKKDALTMHLGKARKVGRHGDEVSVGTTRVQTRSAGTAQHVVLAAGVNMFADVGEVGEKLRPWESNLSSRKKKKKGRKKSIAASKLGVFGPIAEEGDVLEELESLKTSEHLFREDGPSIDHNTLGTLLESTDEDTADNVTFTEDALSSQGGEESIATERELPQEEDGLAELMAISKLESKLEADVDEVDFDDMWDTVSCDASTALEFDKKKREKNKEKERRRLQREKEKEENLTATQRLRLFEKEKNNLDKKDEAKKIRKRRKQTNMKLSTEFKTAINKLFDDDRSVISQLNIGTSAEQKEKAVDIPRGIQLLKQNSVKSLYLVKEGDKDEQSKAPEVSESGGSDDESGSDRDNEEEKDSKADILADAHSVKSSGSRRSRGTRLNEFASVANSRTSSSKSISSKSAKLDPAEIFEREMKRAQGAKFLCISSLRQEMNDRRGTSVTLVKKEYDNYKKRMKCGGAEDIDFGDLHGNNAIQFGASYDKADPFLSPKKVKLANNEEPEDGLERYMSRWDANDGVTELDDLNTIMMSPNTPRTMTGVAQGLTNELSSDFGTLPNMPALGDMPKPSDVQKAIISRKPSSKNLHSGTEGGVGNTADFSFPTAFGDAPLAPIAEQSDDDDDDARGLFSKRTPQFDESDEDDEVKSVRSIRSGMSRRAVSKLKLGGLKKFVPKLKRDANARGMHRMDLLGDNDERGLLG